MELHVFQFVPVVSVLSHGTNEKHLTASAYFIPSEWVHQSISDFNSWEALLCNKYGHIMNLYQCFFHDTWNSPLRSVPNLPGHQNSRNWDVTSPYKTCPVYIAMLQNSFLFAIVFIYCVPPLRRLGLICSCREAWRGCALNSKSTRYQ